MKSNPVFPGGLLTSKPTWSNALECWSTSAFFCSGVAQAAATAVFMTACAGLTTCSGR